MQSTEPSTGAPAPQPGWYPDPWQVAPTRWWDGLTWTGFTTPQLWPGATAPVAPGPIAPGPVLPGSVAGILPTNPSDGARHGALPEARTDIEGGGVALLGYFGAVALSLICAQATVLAGMRPLTVPSFLAGQAGLWGGLWMAAYVVTHRRTGGSIADLGFHAPTRNEVGIGLAIGVGGFVLAGPITNALRALFPGGGAAHLFVTDRPSYALVMVFAVTACVGAPVIEELFFRGVVQTVLMRDLGTTPGIILQAMLFGLADFQLGMTFNEAAVRCGSVMVLGVLLGWLRVRTGRLGAGMVAHATYNTIIILITLAVLAGLVAN